jgi:hypothetical protein
MGLSIEARRAFIVRRVPDLGAARVIEEQLKAHGIECSIQAPGSGVERYIANGALEANIARYEIVIAADEEREAERALAGIEAPAAVDHELERYRAERLRSRRGLIYGCWAIVPVPGLALRLVGNNKAFLCLFAMTMVNLVVLAGVGPLSGLAVWVVLKALELLLLRRQLAPSSGAAQGEAPPIIATHARGL